MHWHNPDVNNQVAIDIGNCLYKDAHPSLQIISMGTAFVISYTPNAEKDYLNPSFAIIHTKTHAKHNTWLHIFRTNFLG